ncbi:MAG: hypothetical protein CVV64_16230 [Candidatus Wallbacteria bacterium HGW-Wallbacteria-1]|uniref:Metallo-beta-lactamase domain-containing protein n=1 Tax=Candidatus Wallbacteria bacterium HGW-Wallbacteria-1 TaxID=2013854 RepID=A0A2N1PKZ5_9BACT|nr:MAG: hypothetical protein CVV64_16230 [Candidatus Wallbacteria bacterium HGW-Wallbacteria-1]
MNNIEELQIKYRNIHRDIRHNENTLKILMSLEIEARKASVAEFSFFLKGVEYGLRNEFKKAEDNLDRAIEINDGVSDFWMEKGFAQFNQHKHEDALRSFDKSLELDSENGHSLRGIGLCYLEGPKDFIRALPFLEQAMKMYRTAGEKYWESLTRAKISHAQRMVAVHTNFEDNLNHDDRLARILALTRDIDHASEKNKIRFIDFVRQPHAGLKDKSTAFEVLRRWNSYTPIIADNFHASKGGGYFLKIAGYGLVIDPGFNFIENFKAEGHRFSEIDGIFITHAHNDHTADLESLLTLLYKYNETAMGKDFPNEDSIRADIARDRNCSIEDVSEKDIDSAFPFSNRRKIFDLYFPDSVFKKFISQIDLGSKNDIRVHIVASGDTFEVGPANLRVIGAKHNDIISDTSAVGVAFELGDTVLICTGDTGFSPEMEEQYKALARLYEDRFIILTAHLGGFKNYELDYLLSNGGYSSFYKNHLGRLGLIRVNEILSPEICLISEFGEEFKGLRIRIAQICEDLFDHEIKIIPADIGLKYDFEKKCFHGLKGLNFRENLPEYGNISFENLGYSLFQQDYSIHYYDNSAGFSDVDMVDVIRRAYDESTAQE